MQKNMNSLTKKDETLLTCRADEVLLYKRPENDFFSVEQFIVKRQFKISKYLFYIFTYFDRAHIEILPKKYVSCFFVVLSRDKMFCGRKLKSDESITVNS